MSRDSFESTGPVPVPPDERLRQCGVRALAALSATFLVGRAYSVKNQAFGKQIANLIEAVEPLLRGGEPALIVAFESDLYLNGVRVPVDKATFKFQQTVLEAFHRLHLAGMRLDPGVEVAELSRFYELCFRTDGPTGDDLLAASSAQAMKGVAPIPHAALDPSQLRRAATPSVVAAAPRGSRETVNAAGSTHSEPVEAVALRRLQAAIQGARLVLAPTIVQTSLEIRHAKRVVQPLVEAASLSQPVVVGLSMLPHHDEYSCAHAVSVCGLAVAIGHHLGLDRPVLSDLGVAALLHDIGKQKVAARIENDLERFTPEERAAAERHTIEGAKLVARSTSLNPTTLNSLRVALEHHTVGGDGYPPLPATWKTSVLSEIVAVADGFVSLQSRLSTTAPAVSPHEALGMILGPLGSRFEPAILWGLVRAVGLYPAGQVVELEDGSLATVLAPNAEDPARPYLQVTVSADGEWLVPGRQTELRPLPAHRSVRRALRLSEYPVDPAESQREAA